MQPPRQAVLPFPHRPPYRPDAFLASSSNQDALAWLDAPSTWPMQRLAVFGPARSGKTHLLHRFAARHAASLHAGPRLEALPPEAGPIAIDDADQAKDPETLLHWLNLAAERRTPVLLAARTPPARWATPLPDLASRLRAIHAVAIHDPDDALLRALLARLLAERQLAVTEPVQTWLVTRLPRTAEALADAAARLDAASLAAASPITRPLAAAILDLDAPEPLD